MSYYFKSNDGWVKTRNKTYILAKEISFGHSKTQIHENK
jgi:hypothetical protein